MRCSAANAAELMTTAITTGYLLENDVMKKPRHSVSSPIPCIQKLKRSMICVKTFMLFDKPVIFMLPVTTLMSSDAESNRNPIRIPFRYDFTILCLMKPKLDGFLLCTSIPHIISINNIGKMIAIFSTTIAALLVLPIT